MDPHLHDGNSCFVLTRLGWRYAAMEAGYGRALKRFAKRRASVRNVRRLVFHLAHTRATNLFFLDWVRMARQCGAAFKWVAEAECGLYFRRGSRLHAWLPDGLGIWQGKQGMFRFVLELDRTRESRANLRQKFREYYWRREWLRERGSTGEMPPVLVVTTGWKCATRIREVLDEARVFNLFAPLPMWVTTFKDIAREGISGRIWQSNADCASLRRLPCFEPKADSEPDFAGE